MEKWKWMKTALFCAVATCSLASCDDDDDDNFWAPEAVKTAFEAKYPGLKVSEWEKKSGYMVAEFRQDGKESEAWFTTSGTWTMTETDLGRDLNALPEAVRSSFQATEYAVSPWRLDDVDRIERPALTTVYKLEVEKGETDVDLYFDADGILFKTVVDSDDEYNEDLLPTQLPEAVASVLHTKYPGAMILEVEYKQGVYEVDLIHEGKSKDVLVESDGTWIRTETELHGAWPAEIRQAVQNAYPAYEIDDMELHDTPTGMYYLVDLEDALFDLMVSLDGTSIQQVHG